MKDGIRPLVVAVEAEHLERRVSATVDEVGMSLRGGRAVGDLGVEVGDADSEARAGGRERPPEIFSGVGSLAASMTSSSQS